MAKKDETLKLILERLNSIDPPIRKIAVDSNDPALNMIFLNLSDVCYITSQSDTGRDEIMFVTSDNLRFYNNESLKKIDTKLKEHPHFMRTSKFHLVNLTKIRGFKYSSARDLWFEGVPDPVTNAVTATYLKEFEKAFNV